MKRRNRRKILTAAVCAGWLAFAGTALAESAKDILDATGVKGGLVVHVGCGDGKLTAALRANDSYLVHGLDASEKNIEAARKHIRKLSLYGKVSVERFDGKTLPYADNLVNLLVSEDLGKVPMDEVMRVLAPNGVAYIKGKKTVKPRPKEIDEWTHYLHDASNNAVAHDSVVGPPRRLQWVGSPKWARHHDHMASLSAMVSAGGRVFYIFDEGSTASLQMPPKWTLIARDAFSGVILWKRSIASWWPHLWPLKTGYAMLPRRLVAVGERVYVTLGLDASLTALDAATGKTLRTFDGTKATEEVIASDGVLFLVVKDRFEAPHYSTAAELRTRAQQWQWDGAVRSVLAVAADTGKVLWRKQRRVVPMTLAVDQGRVFFHDGQKVVCLDRTSGREMWASRPIPRAKSILAWFAPTLVAHKGVVVFAGGEKIVRHKGGNDSMTALSADKGKVLWTAPHPPSGYDSPEDVFILGGLVWTAPTTNRRETGTFTGRDLRTGKVKARFPADDGNHMPHHRCHRAKATDKYILTSRTGIECVDPVKKHWDRNDWVRGGCMYGIMPANGLIYTPPHSCACYILAKLNGLNALAPASKSKSPKPTNGARLEKGPAYAKIENRRSSIDNSADWPTYRHDAARSGRTKAPVEAADLKVAWQTQLAGKLSSPVAAGGRVFVASVDAHAVHALEAANGKRAWSFTAGGRVDSPPTIYRGRVLFGCADGWVYCLRAKDGQLVWRFRAAPQDRRITAFEQVESVWPVHGSVLVLNGEIHCVAGRSMFLDGGMRYLRLDVETGKKLSETVLDNRHPQTGKKLDAGIRWPDLPVALPDVLSCDGRSVYMRSQPFDLTGRRRGVIVPRDHTDQTGPRAHLFSPTGFLDDAWWHRSYWIYGKTPRSGAGGWYLAGRRAPAGRIMVFDEDNVYAFGRRPQHFPQTTWIEYQLFSAGKAPKIVPAAAKRPAPPPKAKSPKPKAPAPKRRRPRRPPLTHPAYRWSHGVGLLARGMVLTGKTLFIAGPPDLVDEQQVSTRLDDAALRAKVAEQADALAGRKGGLLWAVSAADGKKITEYKLDAPCVFDGLIAAGGRLYMATTDGKLICFGKQ